MKIFKNLSEYTLDTPLALSIGMFDGVHCGHQSIIRQLVEKAKKKKLEPALLTFWPHPRLIFNPNEELKLLTTIEEKTVFLERCGIQSLFIQEFSKDFGNLSGEEFIQKILVEKLNVKYLIVGYDHVFGKNKSGNFELLQKKASEFGYEVLQMEAVNLGEKNISSTKIRGALQQGNIEEANQMLGYHYPISGKVIHGKKIGRTIGYPTANIEISENKILPKKGAYIVEVVLDDVKYKGMLSIGTNPTVNGEKLSVEVYILDFDKDIYGQQITVYFLAFLHNEIKFESLEKLIEKLDDDKKQTELFFKNL